MRSIKYLRVYDGARLFCNDVARLIEARQLPMGIVAQLSESAPSV